MTDKAETTGALTLAEAQAIVDRWINTVGVRYFSPLTNMAILAEEVGELADSLWVLLAIANQHGIDMAGAFANNVEKKNVRDCKRHKQNKKITS